MDLGKPCFSISEVIPQVEKSEEKCSEILLQKCWLASLKPGQFDWKKLSEGFFPGHFLQWGLPSFPDLLS